MPITISGYTFEGPYSSPNSLRDNQGVYAILNGTVRPNILYVGESESVRTRVTNNHERESCWDRNNTRGLYYCALYTPGWTKQQRLTLESRIREEFNPVCNRQ